MEVQEWDKQTKFIVYGARLVIEVIGVDEIDIDEITNTDEESVTSKFVESIVSGDIKVYIWVLLADEPANINLID